MGGGLTRDNSIPVALIEARRLDLDNRLAEIQRDEIEIRAMIAELDYWLRIAGGSVTVSTPVTNG
jgi:hypothetical protein